MCVLDAGLETIRNKEAEVIGLACFVSMENLISKCLVSENLIKNIWFHDQKGDKIIIRTGHPCV